MKIEGKAKDIHHRLSIPARATERTSTMPIMEHLLLTEKNGEILVTGSDMLLTVSATIQGQIQPGEASCVPGKKILDLLARLGDTEVVVASDSDHVWTIKGKGCNARINGLPGKEFPLPVRAKQATAFSARGQDILLAIDQTFVASAAHDIRYYLNGLLFERLEGDGNLFVVGTDGYRLAASSIALEAGAGFKMIIPRKSISTIKALVSANDDTVAVAHVNEDACKYVEFILTDGVTVHSKLIDGVFPEWRRVVPQDHWTATANAADMHYAVNIALVVADEQSHAINMKIAPALITVNAAGGNGNVVEETIAAQSGNDTYDAFFNGELLADSMGVLGGEVEFHVGDNNALLIRPVGQEYPLHVVMPRKE